MNFKSRCALCRQPLKDFTPEVDKNLQRYISVKFQEEFDERKKELIQFGLWSSNRIIVQFQYGNDWEEITRPKVGRQGEELDNRWTMYLKTPKDPGMVNKIVESIRFKLHPTYKIPVVTISQAPWRLTRTAWGYFDVEMCVKFQKWTKLSDMNLTHELTFTKKGKHENSKVFITQDALDEHQAQIIGIKKKNTVDKIVTNKNVSNNKTLKKVTSFKRWR